MRGKKLWWGYIPTRAFELDDTSGGGGSALGFGLVLVGLSDELEIGGGAKFAEGWGWIRLG